MDNEYLEELEEQEEIHLDPPKYVVKTTLDAQMQYDASQAVQSKGMQIFGYICMALCFCMFVALIVIYFIDKNPSNLFMAALLLLTFAYFLYSKFTMPKKAMARWESDIQRSYGSPALHLTTEFYGLSMVQTVLESPESISDSGYSQISELKETENLFLLRCGRRQWYFLEKKGFQVGDLDSFRSFITERIGGK